jgi:hypothetical protein
LHDITNCPFQAEKYLDVMTIMVMAQSDFPAIELAPSIRDRNGIAIHQINDSVTH